MSNMKNNSQARLKEGDRVVLHGLKTAVDLNEKQGVLCDYFVLEDRWAVCVDGIKELKKVKPCNLRHQNQSTRTPAAHLSVKAVVIPPVGDMTLVDLPVKIAKRATALQAILRDPFGDMDNYDHVYWLPDGTKGIMTVTFAENTFRDTPLNENFTRLGWNTGHSSIFMRGTAVVQFSSPKPGGAFTADRWISKVKYFEPYDLDTVENLIQELGEARIKEHPTRDRIAVGQYQQLGAMPFIEYDHNTEVPGIRVTEFHML